MEVHMRRWPLFALAAVPLLLSAGRTPSPNLVWWTTHSLEKVRPFDREPHDAAHAVKIAAARNEFEPFQIVLRAEGQDLNDVDVEVSDLRGEGGLIPAEKFISVYFERYLNLTIPSSIVGGTGEYPDPLIPRTDRYANEKRNGFPFKLTSGRSQPIWIDVYVPAATRPGMYHGQVQVLAAAKHQLSVPIDLEVWNFQLPSTSSLPTTFGFSGNAAVRAHYGKYTSDQDIRDLASVYQKAALWHRITLNSSAGVSPVVAIAESGVRVRWDDYDPVVEPFLNGTVFKDGQPLYGAKTTSVSLSTPRLLTTPEQRIQFWRQTAEHFRQKGWFDRLFHYLWDEPKPKEFAAMAELGRTVHRADPKIRNLVTAPLHADWSDFVDIWTPAVNCFERKPFHGGFCDPNVERSLYDSELQKGKELWWYQACGSHGCFIVGGDYFTGWPSYMIDDAPVRNRIMEWLTWKYGTHGELYFNVNEVYASKQDPWKDVRLFGGNGDGTLFYPGRPDIVGGSTQIPIESIRLKLIREGLEDYEYLLLFEKLAGTKSVSDEVDGFIRKIYEYDQDPKPLYSARERIGSEISKRSAR
jgi:hypothetical protein